MIKGFYTLLVILAALILPTPIWAQAGPQVTTSFAPTSISQGLNADFTIEVKATAPQPITVQGYTINVNFYTDKLELRNIEYLVGQRSEVLNGDSNDNLAAINSRQSPAEIRLIGEMTTGNLSLTAGQPVSFARLTFTVKALGQTNINTVSTSNLIVVRPDTSLYTLPLSTAILIVNQAGPPPPPPSPSPSIIRITGITGLPTGCISGPLTTTQKQAASINWTGGSGPFWVNISQNTSFSPYYHKEAAASPADLSGLNLFNVDPPQGIDILPGVTYYLRVFDQATGQTSTPARQLILPACAAPSPSPSPDTACPANITSTQVRGRASSRANWSTQLSMTLGSTIYVAGFHNNQTDTLASDVTLTATGPEGPESRVITLTSPTTPNNIPFTPTQVGGYTLTATKTGKTGANCTGVANLTVNAPAVVTTQFRIAENSADLGRAQWQNYTQEPMIIDNFEFRDKNPGPRFIWVDFKDSSGRMERRSAQIRLLGPNPAVAGCSLSFEGNSTILNLNGQNFGSTKGEVKSGDTLLQAREWKGGSIKAVWQNAPVGQALPVVITNSDSQSAEGQCSAVTQLALGAKVFCRQPSQHRTDNVDLSLAGAYEGGTLAKQKVSINKDGVIEGLNAKLESGKNYKLSLKAPKGLRRTITFTAGDGTTNISNMVLPVGDIFPVDGGDGQINAFDKGELNRQFILTQDSCGRSGDFNQDCRVNSIDWACMRASMKDAGGGDDPDAVPGGPPLQSISPASSSNPSPTATTSASVRPSPSVSPSPNPSPSPSPSPSPNPSPSPSP